MKEYQAPYTLRKNQQGDPVMEDWIREQNDLIENPTINGTVDLNRNNDSLDLEPLTDVPEFVFGTHEDVNLIINF